MRSSGILMHISSLSSPYGIGTMGKEAYEFVDFLLKAGQKNWQILPLSPTSYGDSPYQSFSIYAGNPYFIDLDTLISEGILTKEECEKYDWGRNQCKVDYGKIFNARFIVLKKAFDIFKKINNKDFEDFKAKNISWLPDYALYMALKFENNGKAWTQWDEKLKLRDEATITEARTRLSDEINFWMFIQYKFYEQWFALKKYANEKGIKIIGDIPIYVAYDSADVWFNPQLFQLDDKLNLIEVAGCPPDCFTPKGQLWGNPIYKYDVMKQDDYKWWVERISFATTIYDTVRIDHFRGFDSYYAIPAKDETAEFGTWKDGPGFDLFKTINEKLGQQSIIAEDLGYITQSVRDLLEKTGYPGMKMLQFGFDPSGKSEFAPHNCSKNFVVYTGSHDSETLLGWVNTTDKETIEYAMKYLDVKHKRDLPFAIIRCAFASVCDLAIAQMQDFLELDSDARMNTPSTVGENWKWRIKPNVLTPDLAEKIYEITKLYDR